MSLNESIDISGICEIARKRGVAISATSCDEAEKIYNLLMTGIDDQTIITSSSWYIWVQSTTSNESVKLIVHDNILKVNIVGGNGCRSTNSSTGDVKECGAMNDNKLIISTGIDDSFDINNIQTVAGNEKPMDKDIWLFTENAPDNNGE